MFVIRLFNIYTQFFFNKLQLNNFSVECFCGIEEPPFTKRLPDSSCNMKCPGNPRQSCGGYLTINVYWTGIKSK